MPERRRDQADGGRDPCGPAVASIWFRTWACPSCGLKDGAWFTRQRLPQSLIWFCTHCHDPIMVLPDPVGAKVWGLDPRPVDDGDPRGGEGS
jgi:hypothetical protein